MMERQAAIVARGLLALCVAFSGITPAYAGVPVPRLGPDDGDMGNLIVRIQSVDPGGTDGGNNGGGNNGGGRDGGRQSSAEHPERPQRQERLDTDRIVRDLLSIRRECGRYDDVYRIDCLRQGLEMAAANMSDRPENRDAKRILRNAARQLANIVQTYEDRDAPLLEVPRNANPRFKKRRSYRAVKQSALPRAMARARAVVTEASTQLLRSAENSERRYAHYQQISAAVDSTKTLLRSG